MSVVIAAKIITKAVGPEKALLQAQEQTLLILPLIEIKTGLEKLTKTWARSHASTQRIKTII